MGRYDKRNVTQRLKRTARHDKRTLDEHCENITQFPFIEKVDFFFYDGNVDSLHDAFIVHFTLNKPILVASFRQWMLKKLGSAINDRKK